MFLNTHSSISSHRWSFEWKQGLLLLCVCVRAWMWEFTLAFLACSPSSSSSSTSYVSGQPFCSFASFSLCASQRSLLETSFVSDPQPLTNSAFCSSVPSVTSHILLCVCVCVWGGSETQSITIKNIDKCPYNSALQRSPQTQYSNVTVR